MVARAGDLTAPVGHLGRWKVRDVIAHLGGVHRWATRVVAASSMDGPGFQKSKLDGTELLDWFEEGVTQLAGELAARDPDDSCPNFNPGSPNVVRFWLRRQLNETSLHRFDVEFALEALRPIVAEVAADGIDEYLDVFIRTRGKQTLTAPLRLVATDVDRSWLLTLAAKPTRLDIHPDGSGPAAAEIVGTAEDLLLFVWRRRTIMGDALTVTGDQRVAESFVGSV